MEEGLLSIIVPVYNTGNYIARCLESLIHQSYQSLQIIVVDDGSEDDSAKIIQEYCKTDSRIISVCHSINRGLYQARLTGVALARGQYVGFVDSDDYVSVDYFRTMMIEALRYDCDIVAGNVVRESIDKKKYQYILHNICFGEIPITGEQVREEFYGQEGACYAWHTIWNKIYKIDLWNRCIPYFQKVCRHLTMTEDLAFSCILFYHACSFIHATGNGVYYYCENSSASTNHIDMSFKKFKKNVSDIAYVLDFVEGFLHSQHATDSILKGFVGFRDHYARMWENLRKNRFAVGKRGKQAAHLIRNISRDADLTGTYSDFYFESLTVPWNSCIESIKSEIVSDNVDIISFDVFDTLIVRPLWNPDDLYTLMQPYFEKVCPDRAILDFKKFRKLAEDNARAAVSVTHTEYQDVNLTEIYQQLCFLVGISDSCANALKEHEVRIEKELCRVREVGKDLLEFALASGKKVVLCSDMYLETSDIIRILEANQIFGYERIFLSSRDRMLKSTGSLFDYEIDVLGVTPDRILHIGDNWKTDICNARNKGMKACFLPKARDSFCNTVSEVPTGYTAAVGCLVGGHLTTWDKMYNNVAYRSMAALVATKKFDDPYASWLENSYFNADPYFMGYYAVGMHLLGLCEWLCRICRQRSISRICFLSRDGYLPMKIFRLVQNFFDSSHIQCTYVPCSRASLMPWMFYSRKDVASIPVEPMAHSPASILRILRFCFEDEKSGTNLNHAVYSAEKAGFDTDRRFADFEQYYAFISWFQDHLFSDEKFQVARSTVSAYYQSQIPEHSLVFDLGYSGKIPAALQDCLRYHVVFAYQHHDNEKIHLNSWRMGLDLVIMSHLVPQYSDLVREFFLSEPGHTCSEIKKEGNHIFPVFEDTDLPYAERFAHQKIEEGALSFAKDFVSTFSSLKEGMKFDPVIVSLPFEGLLHESTLIDRQALNASFTDDYIWGQQERINLAYFWSSMVDHRFNLKEENYSVQQSHIAMTHEEHEFNYYNLVRNVARPHGFFAKLLLYVICDRGTLKIWLSERLRNQKVLLWILRKFYRMLRRVYRVFRPI